MNLPELRRRLAAQPAAPSPVLRVPRGPRVPADVSAVVDMARAAEVGREESVWRLVERELGRKPDAHLKALLRWEFGGAWRRWVIPTVLSALRKHRERLRAEDARSRRDEADTLRRGWRTTGAKPQHVELGEALSLYTQGDQVTEVLRAMLDAEHRLAPGDALTSGKVDYRVRYDNRSSHTSVESPWDDGKDKFRFRMVDLEMLVGSDPTQDRTGRLLSEVLGEEPARHVATAYDGVERDLCLSDLVESAGLNPKQRATLDLKLRGFSSKEIAARLGDPSDNTVNRRMRVIEDRLRAAARSAA